MSDPDFVWTVIDTILTRVRQAPAVADYDVQVEEGWPGDLVKNEVVWLNEAGTDLDGTLDVVSFTGPNSDEEVTDVFTLPFEVRVALSKDRAATMRRTLDLLRVVRDVPKTDPTLDFLDGLDGIEAQSWRVTVVPTPAGCIGFGEVVIRAQSTVI